MAGSRFLNLRWASSCRVCGDELPAKSRAWWNAETKATTCVDCRNQPEQSAMPSIAGASAQREHDRRMANHEQGVRERHRHIGGLVLKLQGEPQHVAAWAKGADGERRLGADLDCLASETLHTLHDRRIPGSRANIDHLVVAPSSVYVIDAKQYQGKVERRDKGSIFRSDYRLYVNNRDRTKLIDGMAKQWEAVRRVVDDDVPVVPVLCFIDADWGLFTKPFEIGGVTVIWPRRLIKRLRTDGPLASSSAELARQLQLALPGA